MTLLGGGGSITATPIPAGGYVDTSGSRPPVAWSDAQLAGGVRAASGSLPAMLPAGGAPSSGGDLTTAPVTLAPRAALASVSGSYGPLAIAGVALVVLYLATRR